jgi:phosphatidylglycerol---prolipoprotein diacylglyceryl transferase
LFEIGINPVIFRWGFIGMEWHGVLGALGILIAVVLAGRQMLKRGFDISIIYGLAWWCVIGGIIGARAFHVADYLDYYMAHPLQILAITQGGLAIYGAMFGGFVGAIAYVLIKRLPMGRLFDGGGPEVLLGLAIGRVGCLINGDSWGAPTGSNWGVVYTNPGARLPANLIGVPTHPYPIYEIIVDLLIFGVFAWLRKKGVIKTDGVTTLLVLVCFSAIRFFLTYFRQEKQLLLGLQQAQLIAVACIVTMVPLIVFLVVRNRRKMSNSVMVASE